MNFSREFDDFLENLDFDIDLDIDFDFLESGDMVSNNDLIDFWFSSDVGDDFLFGLLVSGMVKGESTEGLWFDAFEALWKGRFFASYSFYII